MFMIGVIAVVFMLVTMLVVAVKMVMRCCSC